MTILESVDWHAWLFTPGMPPVENNFDKTLAVACETLADKWDVYRDTESLTEAFSKSEFDAFNSNQKVMFFEKLLAKDPFTPTLLKKLDSIYLLSSINNAEIKCRWHLLALAGNYTDILSDVIAFVTSVGRMKFVRPIYKYS